MKNSEIHHMFMLEAIAESWKARLHAPPNPWVGCVIVKDQKIIGKGYTYPSGQAHAEINALKSASEDAKGASLYVTLEPCSHHGKTPPCTEAIIRAGILNVYVALKDPDSRVRGQGIQKLREAGIHVKVGIGEKEAKAVLTPYLYQRESQIPYTVLKIATSVDGRTAAVDGTSQWLTTSEARLDAHLQRAYSQAVVIGSGTATIDSPQLTVRHPTIHLFQQPQRILIDSSGKTPATGLLFDQKLAPTLVLTTKASSITRQNEWLKTGAEVIVISATKNGHVNLREAWQLLAKRGIIQVLVEGGSTLQSALLEIDLVNCLSVYTGPLLIGKSGLPLFSKEIPTLKKAKMLKIQNIKQFDNSFRVDYLLKV
ncbi:bifunctional diaminohydroxyphosphoribosylaminopyrimidine deaminase/5-amino-6-(5-phosphoribosylamino)uracil reductase RibD [Candidatus Protochlamydia amoebophila]|uniref:Riboflavin biosynthesis protein RibD n=1 Tax=Candidatus Protochlamydia amoebophila TaxID=362787 RepID=A0A0C1H1A6_9BACT|nr:bifunctional diaminohydroxyphosphoribosylaminopyrimidine deaminase/5-amino-6-(5-phosphoribosylamino)uracil reductase RibD [Candidatus Protochlamydia amoebophila]KIC71509.1 Riboflavin biosynthesis protein RibD [Candidatus Protochlamydia amoebophila]